MDRQAIFNQVRDHLLAQGVRSVNQHGACLYRGPDGRKCAIGALISDEHYSAVLDRKNLSAKNEHVVSAVSKSLGVDITHVSYCSPDYQWSDVQFLRALQEMHDDHDDSSPDSWTSELAQFAEQWDLVA